MLIQAHSLGNCLLLPPTYTLVDMVGRPLFNTYALDAQRLCTIHPNKTIFPYCQTGTCLRTANQTHTSVQVTKGDVPISVFSAFRATFLSKLEKLLFWSKALISIHLHLFQAHVLTELTSHLIPAHFSNGLILMEFSAYVSKH